MQDGRGVALDFSADEYLRGLALRAGDRIRYATPSASAPCSSGRTASSPGLETATRTANRSNTP